MKYQKAVLATTAVDLHNERFALAALQDMVEQVKAKHIPLMIEHDAVADTFMSDYGFGVEPVAGSGDVRVTEANTGEEGRVRTLDEAEDFAAQCASGGWDSLFGRHADPLTPE